MYTDVQPTYFPIVNRIVVIGDIHGDIARLMQCFYSLNLISKDMKWIAEPRDTIVVQLGDQIDSLSRGGDPSWEVLPDIEVMMQMDKLDKIAKLGGGRVLSMIGNHEMMNFLGEFSYVSAKSRESYDVDKRRKLFAPGNQLSSILAKRNIVLKIGPYLFCHGGLLPMHLDSVSNNLHIINDTVRKILSTRTESYQQNITGQDRSLFHLFTIDPNSILWTREYLTLANTNPDILNMVLDNIMDRTNCKAIFVGHNTVDTIVPAGNGRIFFVDAGLSRAYSKENYQALEIYTDVNTFDVKYNVFTMS
uniref:Calcineurin-like phosphoesterase domain-containing protein n=1 Tax=viral metagenome TaxID=1070528 RepID=A0A6C0KSM0_9ZZZZ